MIYFLMTIWEIIRKKQNYEALKIIKCEIIHVTVATGNMIH